MLWGCASRSTSGIHVCYICFSWRLRPLLPFLNIMNVVRLYELFWFSNVAIFLCKSGQGGNCTTVVHLTCNTTTNKIRFSY